MTNVWCIHAELGPDSAFELVNEGFHGAHGSVADLMEMIERGDAKAIHITLEELDEQDAAPSE
jgi:hypothetical protein